MWFRQSPPVQKFLTNSTAAPMTSLADQRSAPNLAPLLPADQVDFFDPNSPDAENLGPCSETITRWLSELGRLHRAAAGSAEFFADAARFAVEVVGLDSAYVLSRCDDLWLIAGSHSRLADSQPRFDDQILTTLQKQCVTWYQPATDRHLSDESNGSDPPQAVVVAPVLNQQGELVAAIYGARDTRGKNRRRGVRPLEARLVQLLADSVSVGIARLEQETEAARTRVLLEQAFSPTVAEHLQQHPDALVGQLRDVTLLFADLQGYTTLAESLPPADCYDLLGNVMELLTQVVVGKGGVVVDYYGDGLLALWNAPLEQTDHATLACAAAVEMLDSLPAVSDKWQNRLGEPLRLGVGIHTGPALVGNAGTRSRIKYGPRGNTVNVANRVQAASKQLEVPLVLTAATRAKLSSEFFTLRLCTAKLPGLEQKLDLFTAYPASDTTRVKSHLERYAQALALFESGDLTAAESVLEELIQAGSGTPASFLAHHAAETQKAGLGRRAIDQFIASREPVIEVLGN